MSTPFAMKWLAAACLIEYAVIRFFPPRSLFARPITVRLTGCLENNIIKVQQLESGEIEEFDLSEEVRDDVMHAGGDKPFVDEFIEAVRTGKEPVANLRDGLASCVVALAIEQARAEMKVVQIDPGQYQL